MPDDKYSFLPSKCSGCGKILTRAKASLAGMKGNVAMGYCPKCGAANPLADMESPDAPSVPTDEPTEPRQPAETAEGTGEGGESSSKPED